MTDAIVRASALCKKFVVEDGGRKRAVQALQDVDLELAGGETLAVVGESGSGKSTLGRTLLALEKPDSGTLTVDGVSPFSLGRREMKVWRRNIQMVFQDPYASLNPRMSALDLVAEPMRSHGDLYPSKVARHERAAELLAMVGIGAKHLEKLPRAFSGGQLQRIGIARALALRPKVIVCDEPVSGLDLSIQGQVLNVLKDLQRELGVAYVFISHDMSVVRNMADRVAVLYQGQMVECGSTDRVLESPEHEYTRALIAAAPSFSLS
jgi:oligopeptide transport system ATP-binding protein